MKSIFFLLMFASVATASEPFRFARMSAEREAKYRSLVPTGIFTADEMRRAIFYDKDVCPQAFQHGGGWHSVNAVLNSSVAVSHPNKESPWITGGLDDSPDGATFKMYIPAGPMRVGTDKLPIVARSSIPPRPDGYTMGVDKRNIMYGKHAIGTKAVEVMLVDRGEQWTFEIRVLTKVKDGYLFDGSNWKPRWFRPLKNRRDLLDAVIGTSYEAVLKEHYKRPVPLETFIDTHVGRGAGLAGNTVQSVLSVSALRDDLPDMPVALQTKVLSRKFVEVTDVPWVESSDNTRVGYAGTGGPFPKLFKGNLFGSKQCQACHASVLKDESEFSFVRDWYGRVRGTDGVFSFPFNEGLQNEWNRELVKAGLIVRH